MFLSKPVTTTVALLATAGASLFAARAAAPLTIDEFEEISMGLTVDAADGDIAVDLAMEVAEAFLGVIVHDPFGNVLFDVSVADPSGVGFGLTELAVQAKESDVGSGYASFPAGNYVVTAFSVDGSVISTETELQHDLPVRPRFVSPLDEAVVSANGMTVVWRAVGDVDHYVLIVEGPGLELSLEVESDVTSFTVPPGLLRAGNQYELDIAAVNEAGNSVVSEIQVRTAAAPEE